MLLRHRMPSLWIDIDANRYDGGYQDWDDD
jgi:hypothetical protein